MVTNKIVKIDSDIIEIPMLVRSNQKGWVPTFELWPTKITSDTSFIESTQIYEKKKQRYARTRIDPSIGYYYNNDLYIYWKSLIDTRSIEIIHEKLNGSLRACCWQKRYCTYYGTSEQIWLHSIILESEEEDSVKHHISGMTSDNRLDNLHDLPKAEHDSLPFMDLETRKKIFEDPKRYHENDKNIWIEEFILAMSSIVLFEEKASFIARFAEENLPLSKEILDKMKYYINLSNVKYNMSHNRKINSHLDQNYIDAFEIRRYLKKYTPNIISKPREDGVQIALFKDLKLRKK